jgi:UDP-N-acetylglucosamine--N-acetylmuramyl-(pentapeptide) pyrophosphoryl-undecaprenol N-acetylglucosamine transferase
MKVLVSGGGSGGHISPVLAVVSAYKKLDTDPEILYVGSKSGLENKIIPQAGFDYRGISSGKFRRYHKNKVLNLIDPTTLYQNTADLFRFIKGYFEARRIIIEFDPDVVFTKGGYVSLPVGLAAHRLGYPLVIHESDSVMGLSNRMLAKRADIICVSYPKNNYPEIPEEKLIYSGNPVREDIMHGDKKKAKDEFGLSDSLPVILVTGGSQGALVINQLVSAALNDLLKKYQIIHISGERDYDWLSYQKEKLPRDLQEHYRLYNFLSENLKDAFAVSDLVISRAGNNFIAEFAALSKPTVFIPLSSSANNHQYQNARIISRMGGGIMMLQEHLTPQKLSRQIDLLFDDPEETKKMGEKLHSLSKGDAGQIVADEIYRIGKEFYREEKDENRQEEA